MEVVTTSSRTFGNRHAELKPELEGDTRLQHVIPKAIAAAEHERANTLLPTFPIPPQQHHKTHNIVELQSQALSLLHALATTAVGPLSL